MGDKNIQSKDRQIAAQSTMKILIDWSNSCGICLTLKELCALSNILVNYIEGGYTKEIGDYLDKLQERLENKKS